MCWYWFNPPYGWMESPLLLAGSTLQIVTPSAIKKVLGGGWWYGELATLPSSAPALVPASDYTQHLRAELMRSSIKCLRAVPLSGLTESFSEFIDILP